MGQSSITARIMWLLANSEKPLTAAEMGEMTEHSGDYQDAVLRMYREGFIVRRKREEKAVGKNPYEYAIAER